MAESVQSGKVEIDDFTGLVQIVATHLKCFAIRTAQDLIGSIGYAAKSPYGPSFAGFHNWKFTGHVVLATLAAPASVIRKFATAQDLMKYGGVGDAEAISYAIADKLLPQDGAQPIIDLAQQVRHTLWHGDCPVGLTAVRETLQHLADGAALAAELNRGQMSNCVSYGPR